MSYQIDLPPLAALGQTHYQTLCMSATSARILTWDDIPWSVRMRQARAWLEDVYHRRELEAERVARAEAWEWPVPPVHAT